MSVESAKKKSKSTTPTSAKHSSAERFSMMTSRQSPESSLNGEQNRRMQTGGYSCITLVFNICDAAFHFLFVSAHNSSYLTMSSAKPPKPVFVQVPEEPGMRIVPFDPRFQASWFTFSCDSWRVLCFTVFFFLFFFVFFCGMCWYRSSRAPLERLFFLLSYSTLMGGASYLTRILGHILSRCFKIQMGAFPCRVRVSRGHEAQCCPLCLLMLSPLMFICTCMCVCVCCQGYERSAATVRRLPLCHSQNNALPKTQQCQLRQRSCTRL